MAEVSVAKQVEQSDTNAESQPQREPYVKPTIERFSPLTNVTFGTNVTGGGLTLCPGPGC